MSSKQLLRVLPNGIKLYVQETAQSQGWRRIPVNESHWSDEIGGRVEQEAGRQAAAIHRRTGIYPVAAVIQDSWHNSPGDVVPHAGVVYEDKDGNHLSKKHVAQNPDDQAKSDSTPKK